MAVCIANNGSALTRADIYYNDNGTIKTINDMDVWLENNGQMYKFPKKEFCILNLDDTSFSVNTLDGASTYITQNFEFWQDTHRQSNLGEITNTDPRGSRGFKVNNVDKYWFVGNRALTNLVFPGINFFENQAFTLSMRFKFEEIPDTGGYWNDLWVFADNNALRCEWNPQDQKLDIYAESNFLTGNLEYPKIDYTANFTQLDLVCNGRNLVGYQNGAQVFAGTLTRDLISGMFKLHLCTNRAETRPLGTGVYFKNIALWKAALTEQELNDYWKCIGYN